MKGDEVRKAEESGHDSELEITTMDIGHFYLIAINLDFDATLRPPFWVQSSLDHSPQYLKIRSVREGLLANAEHDDTGSVLPHNFHIGLTALVECSCSPNETAVKRSQLCIVHEAASLECV